MDELIQVFLVDEPVLVGPVHYSLFGNFHLSFQGFSSGFFRASIAAAFTANSMAIDGRVKIDCNTSCYKSSMVVDSELVLGLASFRRRIHILILDET